MTAVRLLLPCLLRSTTLFDCELMPFHIPLLRTVFGVRESSPSKFNLLSFSVSPDPQQISGSDDRMSIFPTLTL